MTPRTYAVQRIEERIPMTVAVHLSAIRSGLDVETTFTEDVSSRGARVPSAHRWRPNERLRIEAVPGNFSAIARVAYCRTHREGFVIGLEFLEPSGQWVVNAPVGSGKPLQG
jgi:hypothetical protein